MQKFISFKKIGQFRNVIKDITQSVQFKGIDKDGDPIFHKKIMKRPTLTFTGTVKLHGTNAGVSFSKNSGMWFQSRKNIITVEKDNAGFAFFVQGVQSKFQSYFDEIIIKNCLRDADTVTIFGEWCGGSIQKGVALNQLDKMFVIFAIKVTPFDEINVPYYISSVGYSDVYFQIYNINYFETYSIDIDFENPLLAQPALIKLVEDVEKECPIAKRLGKSGVGEGIVWSSVFKDHTYFFKTKGEKHSISKVKTLVPVDVEKLKCITDFVEYAVTENRLVQGIEQVFTVNNFKPTVEKTGDFLRWLFGDIIKEEIDVLQENNILPKEIGSFISRKARLWFMDYLDKDSIGG